MKRTKLCSPAYIGTGRRRATRKFDRERTIDYWNHVKVMISHPQHSPRYMQCVNGMGRSFFRSRLKATDHTFHPDSGWERSHEFCLCCTLSFNGGRVCVCGYSWLPVPVAEGRHSPRPTAVIEPSRP